MNFILFIIIFLCCSVFHTFRPFLPDFARSKCGTPTTVMAFFIIKKKPTGAFYDYFSVQSAWLYPSLNEGCAHSLGSPQLHDPGFWTNLSGAQKTSSNSWLVGRSVQFSYGKIIDSFCFHRLFWPASCVLPDHNHTKPVVASASGAVLSRIHTLLFT